jgi:drug/metabolite transporter (DMT)-like permease
VAATNPLLGDVIALGSALAWGLTIIGSRWIVRTGTGDGTAVTASAAVGNLLSAVFCLPFALPLAHVDAGSWAILLYLGIFQLGLAYALMSRALPHVPALDVSLILLIEPVVSPIFAFALVREVPGPWSLAGGAIILAATVWKSRVDGQAIPPVD